MSAVTSPLVWEHVQPAAARRLLTGAIDAFAERGFQATTTRDIASRAGMSPAAALRPLPLEGTPALRDQPVRPQSSSRRSLSAADKGNGPGERLAGMVSAFTAWHAEHHTIARVVQYELAAFSPEHFAEVATIRRAISDLIEQVLADGVGRRLVRRRRPARYDARRALALDRCRPVVFAHPARTPANSAPCTPTSRSGWSRHRKGLAPPTNKREARGQQVHRATRRTGVPKIRPGEQPGRRGGCRPCRRSGACHPRAAR